MKTRLILRDGSQILAQLSKVYLKSVHNSKPDANVTSQYFQDF